MKIKIEDMKLTAYEQEILDALERGEYERADNADELIKEMRQAARAHMAKLRKDTRITIRLSSGDLDKIKQRASEEGLPYQTLISSLIHKYVSTPSAGA